MGMGSYGDGALVGAPLQRAHGFGGDVALWGQGSNGHRAPMGAHPWWGRGSMGTGFGGVGLHGVTSQWEWGCSGIAIRGSPCPWGTPLQWARRVPLHTRSHGAPSTRTQGPLRPSPPPFPHGTHLPLSGPEPSSGAGLSCREQSPQERAAPGRTAGRFPMALRERPLPPALGGEWGPPAAPRGTSAAGVGPPGEGTEPPESGRRGARRCCGRWSRCPPRGGHPEGPPGGPPPSSCH